MGFYVPNHADYARTVASFLAVGVLVCALIRPGESVKPQGSRRLRVGAVQRGGMFSAASTDPLPHSKPGTGRLSSTALASEASPRGGAPRARSEAGGIPNRDLPLRS